MVWGIGFVVVIVVVEVGENEERGGKGNSEW